MSGHSPCTCLGTWKEKRRNWIVLDRNCNYSYFEAPKGEKHYSDYSTVSCTKCNGKFRSKANYVSDLENG
jgi:hypothetical protein